MTPGRRLTLDKGCRLAYVNCQSMERPPRKKPKDIALVHGPTDDGEGAKILRYRAGELTAGEVRPVREGQPINDRELVRLKPMKEDSPLCEVEVVHGLPRSESSGPPRVSNDAYRRNWNQVFAKGRRRGRKPSPDLNVN